MASLQWWGLLALLTCVRSVKMHTALRVNPIRRVTSFLEMMQKKVEEEGSTQQELYDKYTCYCQKSEAALTKSIADAEAKSSQLQSDLTAGSAEQTQLATDIAQAQEAKDAVEKTLAEALAIRTKEAAAAAKESAQSAADLASMGKALVALREGTGTAFLQTSGASALRRFANSVDLPEWDKKTIASFLSSGERSEDSPVDDDSDVQDVIGIISQMKETLAKDMKEASEAEKQAAADYQKLVAAKTKEGLTLSKDLQSKTARQGELGVELVNKAQELSDTTKLHEGDTAFLAELTKGCEKTSKEWDERTKTRTEELAAISDTLQLLNNDSAHQLLKRTFPTASLMQVQRSTRQLMREARQALVDAEPSSAAEPQDVRLKLLSMAMRGKKANFDKVQSMIDKMISLLGKEQTDDDSKKEYCTAELNKADDEKKTLEDSAGDGRKVEANSKQMLGALGDDIGKMVSGLKSLDEATAEATEQRKNENAAFREELATSHAAIQILGTAKARLAEFYSPVSLVSKVTEEPKLVQVATAPPAPSKAMEVAALQDAFSFLQRSAGQAEPPPPAPSFEAAKKSNGALALLDTLLADMKKQVTQMKTEEKDAQAEYKQLMSDSSQKHATEAKALSEHMSIKANTEIALRKHSKELKTLTGKAAANDEYLASLHKECDWMLEHFEVRHKARSSEVDSLKKAKAVLTGADADAGDSFLQVLRVKGSLRGGSM